MRTAWPFGRKRSLLYQEAGLGDGAWEQQKAGEQKRFSSRSGNKGARTGKGRGGTSETSRKRLRPTCRCHSGASEKTGTEAAS